MNQCKLTGFASNLKESLTDDFVLSRPSASAMELIFQRKYFLDRVNKGTFARYYNPN